MKIRPVLLFAGALAALQSPAANLAPSGVFIQAGVAEESTYTAGVGAWWTWSWRRAAGPGEFGGITEAAVSRWSAQDHGGRVSFTQLAVVPLLRYRFDRGRSPWFVEGGIGLTLMDRTYRTSEKEFSTRFNFVDVLGVGRSFGEGQRHEASLRLTHFSNGGFRHPNPGENLVRLRYGRTF